LETEGFRFFFAGDTGYSKDFINLGEKFGQFHLAALPIGAYAPRWFMKDAHVNPEEAVMIHQDIKNRYSVGIHWGTFILIDETVEGPPKRLLVAIEKE
jgi:L-ascorbate metabolism protein UlaG (beta-lactamase superfamily)